MRDGVGMDGLRLRKADKNDCELLFYWRNDVECRKGSFHKDAVTWREHEEWFENCLESDHIFIFILIQDDEAIGQIRIEVYEARGKISYSIDKNHRGKGFGKLILKMVEMEMWKRKCLKLYAEVLRDNRISQQIFRKLGYIEYENETKFYYEKQINLSSYKM